MTIPKWPVSFQIALLLLGLVGGTCLGAPAVPAASSGGSDVSIQPIQPVRIEKIVSAKVGETREFWVSLPDGYSESGEKYPVLYMMDGDFNFNSGIIGGIRYAALLGEMPEFIIVGIKNTDRSKDIFPEEVTYRDGSKDGGRADRYLDFIREDLLDEKKYAAALEVLQYRADLYPRSADARVALGDAYRQSGQTAKARECYNQALAIAPGHAAATSKLGELDKK